MVEDEATIVGTTQSGVAYGHDATNLLDGKGIDGILNGCAHTFENSLLVRWFSLELDATRTVTRVQIARRSDCCEHQGQNVKITIGPSRVYDANEALCRPEVPNLDHGGLIDYPCLGSLNRGKYVKISKSVGGALVLCEVKVFVNDQAKYMCQMDQKWHRKQEDSDLTCSCKYHNGQLLRQDAL